MKQLLILFIIVLCPFSLFSQISFAEHEIAAETTGFKGFRVADLDNDGDLDIIASFGNNNGGSIVWYENLNGEGVFGSPRTITSSDFFIRLLEVGDYDNDGDIDILYSSDGYGIYGDSSYGFKNNNGNGVFNIGLTSVGVSIFIVGPFTRLKDYDGDGDLDVIIFDVNSSTRYYTNDSGNFDFQPYTGGILVPIFQSFAVEELDIDNDGDLDVFSAGSVGSDLFFYENTSGVTNLDNPVTVLDFDDGYWPVSISFDDLDGDGDLDIVSSLLTENISTPQIGTIVWNKNLDGVLNYGVEQTISADINRPNFIDTNDLDNDGDVDIIGLSFEGDSIFWNINIDGQGNFSDTQGAIDNIYSEFFMMEDINGDGLDDIITILKENTSLNRASSLNGNRLAWFENVTTLSVSENSLSQFSIYPNPTTGYLNIEYPKELLNITVFNQIGQKVLTFNNTKTVDISSLTNGIYFVKLKAIDGATTIKKVVKN